jgi:hypothetical protein
MAKMLCTTSDTGHQRRTAVEITRAGDDSLDFRVMIHLAKFRLGFDQALEETTEITINAAASSEVTTETTREITGQTTVLGFRGPL